MEDLRLTQAEIYLQMTINKMLFRKISMKRKGLSDLKIKEVESTIEDLNEHLTAAHFNASTDELFVDGVSQGTGTVATFQCNALLRSGASNYISGYTKEIVIYTTDQLSNNSGIQSNINAFYSIY